MQPKLCVVNGEWARRCDYRLRCALCTDEDDENRIDRDPGNNCDERVNKCERQRREEISWCRKVAECAEANGAVGNARVDQTVPVRSIEPEQRVGQPGDDHDK